MHMGSKNCLPVMLWFSSAISNVRGFAQNGGGPFKKSIERKPVGFRVNHVGTDPTPA